MPNPHLGPEYDLARRIKELERQVSFLVSRKIPHGTIGPSEMSTFAHEMNPNIDWSDARRRAKYPADDGFQYVDTPATYLRNGQTNVVVHVGEDAYASTRFFFTDVVPVSPGDKVSLHMQTLADGVLTYDMVIEALCLDSAGEVVADGYQYITASHVDAVQHDSGLAPLITQGVVTVPDGAAAVQMCLIDYGSDNYAELTGTWIVTKASAQHVIGSTAENGQNVEISRQGFRAYVADGSVAAQLGTWSDEYLDINGLAGINAAGNLSAQAGSFADDVDVMGIPILGDFANWTGPGSSSATTSSWLGSLPRGVISTTQTNAHTLGVDNQERGILEADIETVAGRNYQVNMAPMGIYVTPANGINNNYGTMYIRATQGTDPPNPKFSDPVWCQQTVRTTDTTMFTFGGSWLWQSATTGVTKFLFSFGSDGVMTAFNADLGGDAHVWVTDVGPNVADSGVTRGSYVQRRGDPAPPPPATNPKKTYTRTWEAKYTRTYRTGSGTHYSYDESKLFQGQSPAAGDLHSIVIFPDVTGILSGAEILDINLYLYFEHWWYNAGGTAHIGVHGYTSLPGQENGEAEVFSRHFDRNQGFWMDFPESFHDNVRNGSITGISLTGNSLAEYGYASAFGGRQPKWQIKYRK